MIFFDAHIIGPWVCEKAGGTWFPGRGTAVGEMKDGRITAGVLYEDYREKANIVCHIRGEPGWANRKFLSIIYDYPFNQLQVKRVTVPVDSTNEASIRLVEHMGFKLECTLKQAIPDGDLLLYVMFKEDCKYIRGRYALPARNS